MNRSSMSPQDTIRKMRFLPLVLKNCWRNRRRTTLTVLSIAASLCLLGLLLAIYHAFYFSAPPPERALRLITRNKVSLAFGMPQSYGDRIRRMPGVREVAVIQWFGGVYKDARDPRNMFARLAFDDEKLFPMYAEWRVPEDQKRAYLRDRTACVIGRGLANTFGFRLGDRITLVGDIFPVTLELTVRAIYDADENVDSLFFHRTYLEESLPEGRRGQAGTFDILADSPESVPRIAAAVDEEFRNATVQTKTEAERMFQLSFINFLGNIKLFLLSICAAVTFTVLLVSANTIAMSVRERIREVGVLKTLGFTPGGILGLLLGESMLVAAAGGALGCGLAALLCAGVHRLPIFIEQLKTLTVRPPVAAACILVALAVGFLSAIVPAWSAARTPIVEALRSTD